MIKLSYISLNELESSIIGIESSLIEIESPSIN